MEAPVALGLWCRGASRPVYSTSANTTDPASVYWYSKGAVTVAALGHEGPDSNSLSSFSFCLVKLAGGLLRPSLPR